MARMYTLLVLLIYRSRLLLVFKMKLGFNLDQLRSLLLQPVLPPLVYVVMFQLLGVLNKLLFAFHSSFI